MVGTNSSQEIQEEGKRTSRVCCYVTPLTARVITTVDGVALRWKLIQLNLVLFSVRDVLLREPEVALSATRG